MTHFGRKIGIKGVFMKMLITMFCIMVSLQAFAGNPKASEFGYLTDEQQKFYKNGSNEGKNQYERIDSLVVETNKLEGKIKSMEDDIATLKKEIEVLKAKKWNLFSKQK